MARFAKSKRNAEKDTAQKAMISEQQTLTRARMMGKYHRKNGVTEDLNFERLAVNHNKFGYKGVDYAGHLSAKRGPKRFRARIGSGKNRINGPFVATAKEAAEIYDNMARKRYGLRAHLNFPNEGERAANSGRTSTHCRHGHPFKKFGIINPTTGWMTCRRCNLIRINTRNWGRPSVDTPE